MKELSEDRQQSRARRDLFLGMILALVLALLNIALNFRGELRDFFRAYSRLPVADWLILGLLVWFVALLGLAFNRWRVASRRSAELETIVSCISPDALLVLDPDDTVRFCNDSVTHIFGFGKEEVIGQNVNVLYKHWRLGSDGPEPLRQSFAQDGFYIGGAMGRRRNGEGFPLEIIGAELSDGRGRVMLLRDMSERVHVQQQQHELEARVEQWKKLESLAVLAGGIAHDFKNLLTVASANADLAKMQLPEESPARSNMDAVSSAARRAAEMCDKMLAYSGKGALGEEKVNVSETVRQCAQLLHVPVSRHVTLEYDLDDDVLPVTGEGAQIAQMAASFMANALDAIAERGGTMTIKTGVRTCTSEELADMYLDEHLPAGSYVFLEVRDTGCGMDETTLERMFDPFFTTKHTGRGLQLSFALGVIRSHGGNVSVQSEVDKGTCVTVYLPARTADTVAPGVEACVSQSG